MATLATKTIIIDDTDRYNFKYEGDWMLEHGSRPGQNGGGSWDSQGSSGQTMFSTLQAINGEGSFSFKFRGSNGRIVGTNTVQGSETDGFDPQWTCAIDGVAARVPPYVTGPRNNHIFCDWETEEEVHTVTFNITRNGRNPQPFLFDYAAYTPPEPFSQDGHSIVQISAFDTSLRFDDSWTPFGSSGMRSGEGGSSFTFSFYGTGIQLLGEIPGDLRAPSASATYTLDTGRPITFEIPGNSQTGPDRTNQRLFEIPSILYGLHNITVAYAGNQTTTPLIVTSCIVHRAMASGVTGFDPVNQNTSEELPVGPIVGLVVGIVVLLVGAFFLWRLIWRRRKIATEEGAQDQDPGPHLPTSQLSLPSSSPNTTFLGVSPISRKGRAPITGFPATPSSPLPSSPARKGASSSPYPPGSPQTPSGLSSIPEIRHEDSGLRIVDGVVTSPIRSGTAETFDTTTNLLPPQS